MWGVINLVVDLLVLLSSLLLILTGAKIFTNGIEWLGKSLNLSEGAVGSVLAAVGTALPETMVPLIAILFAPAGNTHDVGIGAILGAPFMLSTLALGVVGVSKLIYCRKGSRCIDVKRSILIRDLKYFLFFYSLTIAAAFFPSQVPKAPVTAVLIIGYALYVKKTLGDGDDLANMDLPPLYLWKRNCQAPLYLILVQVAISLVLIAAGARFFVNAMNAVAEGLMVPALILSLIVTPFATELPEKLNSIIWVKGGKDTLALGNITGAMVFQSTVIPGIGILITPWELSFVAVLSALLALLSGLIVYIFALRRSELKPVVMMYPAIIYGIFLLTVITII